VSDSVETVDTTSPEAAPVAPAGLRLDSIAFANFRGFAQLQVSLDPQVTVVFGENASGKTNLLSGIARLLAGLFQKAPFNLKSSDAHEAEVFADHIPRRRWPVVVSATGALDGQPVSWSRSLPSESSHTSNAEVRELRERFKLLLASDRPWPVVARYGTERLHNRVRDVKRRRPSLRQRFDGYTDCLDPRSNEQQVLQWLFEMYLYRLTHQPSPAYDGVEALLRALVWREDESGERIALTTVEMTMPDGYPLLRFEDGGALRWEEFSDGYATFVGMAVDIARRCWILNGGVLKDPIRETDGVVLVDELELHLHPRWQARAMEGFLSAFPRVQFVVTTHTPLVLAGVKNHQVRELREGRLDASYAHVYGNDPNTTLTETQGAKIRPAWVVTALEQIADHVHRRRWDDARSGIEALEKHWGMDHPEIIRLRSWLEPR